MSCLKIINPPYSIFLLCDILFFNTFRLPKEIKSFIKYFGAASGIATAYDKFKSRAEASKTQEARRQAEAARQQLE